MSSNNIEIEAKVLLSKADYEHVVAEMNVEGEPLVQTNYYLDSVDRTLQKYGMILRIRETNGIYKLTCKAPLSEGLLEKNQVLKKEDALNLIQHNIFPRGEISNFIQMLQFDLSSFKVLAHLTTERRNVEYQGYVLDFSVNSYGSVVDYEIECDADSAEAAENVLRDFCSDYDVEFRLNHISKENRAIHEAMKK